jgi:hypothetical protein
MRLARVRDAPPATAINPNMLYELGNFMGVNITPQSADEHTSEPCDSETLVQATLTLSDLTLSLSPILDQVAGKSNVAVKLGLPFAPDCPVEISAT